MSRIHSSGMSFIQGYRKVTISLRHVANTRTVKPLRFLAHAQGRFARDRKSIVAVAKSLNSNDMKSQAIEKCWDQVRLASQMACDLRCTLEELQEMMHDVWLNPGPIEETEHEAYELESFIEDMAYDVSRIEEQLDEWTNDNSPF